MDTFSDWDTALSAKTDGQMICGTLLKGGEPRYFLMSADSEDLVIRDRSFQIREGRDISEYELQLLEQAQRIRTPVPEVSAA